jgi:hypothetical protein
MNVLVYRRNEREEQHPGENYGASAGITHAGDQLLEKATFAALTRRPFLQLVYYPHTAWHTSTVVRR